MRKLLAALLLLVSLPTLAQFTPGQVLTAAQLNNQFALYVPLAGATLTGPLTVPTLTVTGTTMLSSIATSNATITGGAISGLSSPIGLSSGGTNASTATGAAGQLQFQSSASGSTARTYQSKFQDILNVKDFGAVCDGSNNDDAAITSAFAAITPGVTLTFPAGTCTFSTAKTLPTISNGGLAGAGSGQTTLLYTGTNTTNDLITLGNGTTSITGWNMSGFTIQSNTKMTAGAALHLKRMQNGNSLYDVNAGAFAQSSVNLWKGIWLDNVNVFKYNYGNIQVQNDGLDMNGSATSDEGSDIFLDNLAVTFSSVGYRVGGGQGGIYFGKTLAFDNNVNYRVDNGLVSRKNREIFFSDEAVSDGNTNYGIHINDTLTSNSPIVINAHIGSAGVFGSGGAGYNVYVQSWPNGRISFGPGQLYNATSDALRVDDATAQISISPGRFIFNNGGYAVNATSSNSNISNLSQFMASNTSGNYSSNVSAVPFDTAADHYLDYIAGNQRGLWWRAGSGSSRWKWSTDGSAETGSNAGSNILLGRYSDSGTYIDSPISVVRSNGYVVIPDGLQLNGTNVFPNLSGTTGSIGGSALAAGACTSGTTSVSGSTTSMAVEATPVTYPGDGIYWRGYVSASGTVTVKVCAAVAATPTASAYNVRVLQ